MAALIGCIDSQMAATYSKQSRLALV